MYTIFMYACTHVHVCFTVIKVVCEVFLLYTCTSVTFVYTRLLLRVGGISKFTLPGAELAVFGSIVRQLLGDAQQRIVFRAQVSRRGFFATCIYCTVRYKVHI